MEEKKRFLGSTVLENKHDPSQLGRDVHSVGILKIKLYWESGLTTLQPWEGNHTCQHTD